MEVDFMGKVNALLKGVVLCLAIFLPGAGEVAGHDEVPARPITLRTKTWAIRYALHVLRACYQPCPRSHSVGRPSRGRLECARLLPVHPRLLPCSSALFGTQETMDVLRQAADFMEQADPKGTPIEVLDISLEHGGPFEPDHVSHQSGRDVDLSYIYVDGFHPGSVYREFPLEKLDVMKTWLLIRGLIQTGRVQLMLIDHEIQALLYAQAKRLGVCNLKRIFQYPRGPKVRRGLIRHYPNHRDHIHLRLRCPKGDSRCRG
jgi:murein endopeptidase